jgi:biopolymer transport protein ExbB/TolQ
MTAVIALIKKFWKPLVLIALVASSLWAFSHWRYTAGYNAADQAWQLKWSQRDAVDTAATLKREGQERAEEQRRQLAADEERKHVEEELAKARSDAAAADRAGAGLRKQLETLQRQLAGSETGRLSATVAASSARTEASILLAQLLSESDEMAGKYATEADKSYVSGQSCERTYDKVTNQKANPK